VAQITITANIKRKEIVDRYVSLLSEKFEVKFHNFHIWNFAFFLSLKSNISVQKLENYKFENAIQQIKMNVETLFNEDDKYIFVNLLSLVHQKKIEMKEEFPELLKLHCRHGFDILEKELETIGINDNIIDFFINQLEPPSDEDVLKYQEDTRDKLLKIFENTLLEMKAPLQFVEEKKFNRVQKLYFKINDINYVNQLFKEAFISKLEVATALRGKIYIEQTIKERLISINILQSNPPIYLSEHDSEFNINDLSFIVGMNDEDNVIEENLKELVHLLVAGTTGSGKTVFLHTLIYQFMKKDIELYLIDGKNGFEFGKYAMKANVVMNNEEIFPIIEFIIEEMEERFRLNNIEKSKPIIVIIDEFVDLIMQDSDIEALFVRLAQKGRGAKVHLVLATQRPDSNILKGVLRSNIPSRVAFKVQKSTESKIILDEIGAEKLFGKGDMLFSNGKNIKRLQGFLI